MSQEYMYAQTGIGLQTSYDKMPSVVNKHDSVESLKYKHTESPSIEKEDNALSPTEEAASAILNP